MKLSTSSTLFCIFAYGFVPSVHNRSVLISASEIPDTTNNSKNSLTSVSTSSNALDPSQGLYDFSGGHLSLLGLDPNQPLTEAEAIFLGDTIRDTFNEVHEEMGIELYASSVDISQDMVVGDNEARHSSGNLRGRRELPSTCEECVFDLDFFMDCHSEDPMVQPRPYPQVDDVKRPMVPPRPYPQGDDVKSPMVPPRPYPQGDDVKRPMVPPRPYPHFDNEKHPMVPPRPYSHINDGKHPMVQPRPFPKIEHFKDHEIGGPLIHQRPPPAKEGEEDRNIPMPWIHPFPHHQVDDGEDHDIAGPWVHQPPPPEEDDEEEIEPFDPFIHHRPIPIPPPPTPKPQIMDWKVLMKLKQGPFLRFHEVVKVSFKGGN